TATAYGTSVMRHRASAYSNMRRGDHTENSRAREPQRLLMYGRLASRLAALRSACSIIAPPCSTHRGSTLHAHVRYAFSLPGEPRGLPHASRSPCAKEKQDGSDQLAGTVLLCSQFARKQFLAGRELEAARNRLEDVPDLSSNGGHDHDRRDGNE